MRRSLILGLLSSLLAGAANAACPGNPTTCGNAMQAQTSGSVMYAAAYGVKADGTTSDDVALHAAVAACAADGTTLILPPGMIRLSGAGPSSQLSNCRLQGAGPQAWAGNNGQPVGGTTFQVESRTVSPFIVGNSATIAGVNFWWPNQDGTTTYAPAITDGGANTVVAGFRMEDVTAVNAYDFLAQDAHSIGWGNAHFVNVSCFAVRDCMRFSNIGDGFVFSNYRSSAGPWLMQCNYGSTCKDSLARAMLTAVAFHFVAKINNDSSTGGGFINIALGCGSQLGAGTGILVDAGATVSESMFCATWDGLATILDASASGANWLEGNVFMGNNAGCYRAFQQPDDAAHRENKPCFRMGATGELALTNFSSSGSQGDFITTAGASVKIIGGKSVNIGQRKDGGDYHQIHVTAGTPYIMVQHGLFGGMDCGAEPVNCHHVHGIKVESGATPYAIKIENNWFSALEDAIVFPSIAGTTTVLGNSGDTTHGTSAVSITGPFGVMYNNNIWDKPPKAVCASCGAGGTALGAIKGAISMGTGAGTSATVTLPFAPEAGSTGYQYCAAMVVNSAANAGCSVSGKTMSLNFSADVSSNAVTFDATAMQ
jgi:hypothetical protein